MPKLSEAKLGDVIKIYLNNDGGISNIETGNPIKTIVIGINSSGPNTHGLGWKSGEYDGGLGIKRGMRSTATNYLANDQDYIFSKWPMNPNKIEITFIENKTKNQMSFGHQCSSCHDDFPYAEHNSNQGLFVCFGCKMWKKG